MLSIVELFYLIKELNYYENNIIIKIKYFYEFELDFIENFKEFLNKQYYLLYNSYSFSKGNYKYNDSRLNIHPLFKLKKIVFTVNIKYNFCTVNEKEIYEEKILIIKLSLYDIVNIILLSYKKNNKNKKRINFEKISYENILDKILESKFIYKKHKI